MSSAIGQDGLSELAKAVFKVVLERGEATRRLIATEVEISFATVTYVMEELTRSGLVREVRREKGPRGRSTLIYGIAESAGWILAVDIGSTQVSYLARGLDGSVLGSHNESISRDDLFAPARRAAAVTAALLQELAAYGPPLSLAIGINHIVPKTFPATTNLASYRLTEELVATFLDAARIPEGVPVLVENNVNCGAVAEHADGMMLGLDDCAYMQIGVRIGLGIFTDGTLVRGGHGAGGEIALIPLSWTDEIPETQSAIEEAFGSDGLLAAARRQWPADEPLPASAEEVFAQARLGHPVARSVMRQHAVALARIAAAVTAVIDPSVLVLGGGLSRAADFVAMLREEFSRHGHQTVLRASTKGTGATVDGAAYLAHDLALSRLLGSHHRALLPRPALWPRQSAVTL